jgi:methionyl aminopeptidase
VDHEVVHGIPSDRVLLNGEIVGVDLGVEWDGYYGDAARTYAIGAISAGKRRLMEVTEQALAEGIAQARPGNRLSDISHAIQQRVEDAGFSVVRELVGHGIGQQMHEDPQIPNYGPPHQGPRLKAGMVFAIEPMVNMGTYEVLTEPDNWTVTTKDGLPSAHFEHTVVITAGEPRILTLDEE